MSNQKATPPVSLSLGEPHSMIYYLGGYSESSEDSEEMGALKFERALWDVYGLTGEHVPEELLKECQRRLRNADPGSDSELDAQEELQFLDQLHQYRKQRVMSFATYQPSGTTAKKLKPSPSMLSKRKHFWALVIGNDNYPLSPLGGCVNDAQFAVDFLTTYIGVPRDHIFHLTNAPRDVMVNALYDLRDDHKIQPGDNIIIHYSGHGSSYDSKDFFTSPVASVGSIEAISNRQTWRHRSRYLRTQGFNTAILFECCHSGGVLRSLEDTLAACQNFQPAEESNGEEIGGDRRESVSRLFATKENGFPRYGRFTWELIKILQSDIGFNANYASVINMLSKLAPMQVPAAVGSRKNSQLWLRDMINSPI
ncbi:hypothetical protein C8J57DRAFT_1599879 [Mycena rebaudengoi]|nr:hypothetical protein C8J57DRAFT_1599879 [Mycena rebaudengoi]